MALRVKGIADQSGRFSVLCTASITWIKRHSAMRPSWASIPPLRTTNCTVALGSPDRSTRGWVACSTLVTSLGSTQRIGCCKDYRWENIRHSTSSCGDLCYRALPRSTTMLALSRSASSWVFLRPRSHLVSRCSRRSGTQRRSKGVAREYGSASTASLRYNLVCIKLTENSLKCLDIRRPPGLWHRRWEPQAWYSPRALEGCFPRHRPNHNRHWHHFPLGCPRQPTQLPLAQ
jgi:hypothetical protein